MLIHCLEETFGWMTWGFNNLSRRGFECMNSTYLTQTYIGKK